MSGMLITGVITEEASATQILQEVFGQADGKNLVAAAMKRRYDADNTIVRVFAGLLDKTQIEIIALPFRS